MHQLSVDDLFAVAEIEISYKSKPTANQYIQITNSSIAYDVLKRSWNSNKLELVEQFKIMLLDHANKCLGISEVATGGVAMCPVDRKIVFATALKARASRIICAHNHPSGTLVPSECDLNMTRLLIEAGKIVDIPVIEHIILTPQRYYSFADNGLIP